MRRLEPQEWKRLVSEYESSGESQKEFVARHDLSLNTFHFWLYKLRKLKNSESESPRRFVPVEVIASAASSTRGATTDAIELLLRSGTAMRVPVGTNVRYLAELLSALG